MAPESFREVVEVSRPTKEDVGATCRVEEKREEIRVKYEPVDEFLDINLPNPTPVARPVVIMKQ